MPENTNKLGEHQNKRPEPDAHPRFNRTQTGKLGPDEEYPTNEAVREAATKYISNGFAVVPVEDGKNPNKPGWQKLHITEEQVTEFFTEEQNIGLLLGEPSGGLVDVDLDAPEAVAIAGRFLSPTRTSGRKSARDSHWWYFAPGAETEQFTDLDGKMLVELRSTGAQTLVAPSVHPESGEAYEWRDNGLGIVKMKPEKLLADCRQLATSTLIARHLPKIRDDATGEGGGRHHYAMALAGFLLRPGRLGEEDTLAILKAAWDAKGFPSEQKKREARCDLEGIVRDTATNIEAGRNVTGGPTLDEIMPNLPRRLARYWVWDVNHREEKHEASLEATPISPLGERVLLGAAVRDGIEPPEEFEPSVLLKGGLHHVFAGAGKGKSWLALWLTKQAVERSERVLLLDKENGRRIVAERLGYLGVDASNLDGLLDYRPEPALDMRAESVDAFEQLLEEFEPGLVVFDSWVGFITAAGLDENSNTEIERWAASYARAARSRGCTVVLLDHVPHEAARHRGAMRKKDLADVQWELKTPEPFDRDKLGRIELHLKKDRESWLPKKVNFTVGGGEDDFIFSHDGVQFDSGSSPKAKLTPADLKALEYLRQRGSEGASWSELEEVVPANGSRSRALKKLQEVGYALKVDNRYYHCSVEPESGDSIPKM